MQKKLDVIKIYILELIEEIENSVSLNIFEKESINDKLQRVFEIIETEDEDFFEEEF